MIWFDNRHTLGTVKGYTCDLNIFNTQILWTNLFVSNLMIWFRKYSCNRVLRKKVYLSDMELLNSKILLHIHEGKDLPVAKFGGNVNIFRSLKL
jgi:hypothetical protein